MNNLVKLYFNTDLGDLPHYLLNDKKFMFERINTIYKEFERKSNLNDIYNKKNPFKYDQKFLINSLKLLNNKNTKFVNYHIMLNIYDNILIKDFDFLYKITTKFPIFYFFIKQYIDTGLVNFPIQFHNLCNDFDFKKSSFKNVHDNNMNRYIFITDNDYDGYKDDIEMIFTCLKYNFYIPYLSIKKFSSNKFVMNFMSKYCYNNETENFNYLISLRNIKKEKYILNNIDKYYSNNNFFITYCSNKYGTYINNEKVKKKLNINHLRFSSIRNNNFCYFKSPLRLWYNEKNNVENMDLLYLLTKHNLSNKYLNNINKKKIIPYFFEHDILVNRMLNVEYFILSKLIYKQLKYNNNFYTFKNDSFQIILPKNLNIIINYAMYSLDLESNFIDILPDIFFYDIKFLEKLYYYNGNINNYFKDYNNNKYMKLFSSKYIDFSKKNVNLISNIMYEDEKIIQKIVKKHHFDFFFNYDSKNDNVKMLDFIKKSKLGILDKILWFKNDKNIVIESLKNDPEMIYYCDVKYINKYVDLNYDVKKLIHYLENNVELH